MTDFREFNAATVEEALAKATKDLGVSQDELTYEILDSGSEGFLGIGARDARIRVALIKGDDDVEEDSSETAGHPLVESENLSVDGGSVQDEHMGELRESSDELMDEIRRYVSSVVGAMGLDSRVDVYDTDEYIAVDIASDHTALLIGQKGETIDSLQHLTNSAVYKDRPFVKRIILDSEGYRQRRVEAIQGMAHRTARKSVRERRNIQMPPMNSSERRIVHVYLKDNPEVTTFSEGAGDGRRVIVSPN